MFVVNSGSVFWWRSEKDSTFFSTHDTKPENSGLLVKEVVIIASTDRGSQSVRADENHLVVEKTATTLEIYYTWQDVDDDGDSFWHLFSCTVETMVATNFFYQPFSRPPTDAFHLQSFILYNCTTQTLPSYLHHVWSFSNGLRTGLVVWMMKTLKETIYDDETLTLLLCLLSWASRTRLGWNRRANAENGILILIDEQVLTICYECWKWRHAIKDLDILIEETSLAILHYYTSALNDENTAMQRLQVYHLFNLDEVKIGFENDDVVKQWWWWWWWRWWWLQYLQLIGRLLASVHLCTQSFL